MNKYYITKKSDIGKKGPGTYVLDEGKDKYNKPKRKTITCTDPLKMVDQAQTELTKIDNLLEPARRQGLLNHAAKYEGEYDDYPAETYEEALNVVSKSQQMFESLPSDIRNKHGNDPKSFLAWAHDPANQQEMMKMGIIKGNDGVDATGAASTAPTEPPPPPPEPAPEPTP